MTASFVITGVGLVTAAGDTAADAVAALSARAPYASQGGDDRGPAAPIENFDAKRYLFRKGVKDLSRASQLACSAAAGNARGLVGVPADRVGVVLGSAWGSLNTVIAFEREAHLQGARFVDPILFTETVSNVPAGQVAILYGWSGFNATVSSASASGLAAVRQALRFLEEGRGSVAVAGGCDEINIAVLRALRGRGLSAGDVNSLPLAARRSGPVGGEGAAFLTIEPEAHARERGAQPIATIRGAEACFSPGGAAEPRAARASMAALIRRLAERAGLSPRDVDLIALSASGSVDGDAEEAGAVLDVFGRGPSAPPVVAPKSIFGETWGASGALAVAIAVEAMRSSTVPASPLGFVLDPALDGLNVPGEIMRRPMRNALILDRTDSGHQIGVLVSVVEPHDAGH